MLNFDHIYDASLSLNGQEKINSRLKAPSNAYQLKSMSDAEYLSAMSKRIFRAGLRHSMVDKKWPEFEKVFSGFEVDKVRLMSNDDLDILMKNEAIIRHWRKISAVRENAETMHQLLQKSGSFGEIIAEWPAADIVGLWAYLANNFRQLGGNSAPYFLRMIGKDTFVLTNDVLRALNHWGVFRGNSKSRSARMELQQYFNDWQEQSGRPLCHVSQILALSIE